MTSFLFSCENATCAVPEAFRGLFSGSEDLVTSPRGWEPGALNLAQAYAMQYRTPLVHSDVTRLLVNIEEDEDQRWSEFSEKLSNESRLKLAERHLKPYRLQLRQRIDEDLRRYDQVVHVMVHTDSEMACSVCFETPYRDSISHQVADCWLRRARHADLNVVHAKATAMKPISLELVELFPADRYAQIRLMVSQSFFLSGKPWRWAVIKKHLLDSLSKAVDDFQQLNGRASSSTAQD